MKSITVYNVWGFPTLDQDIIEYCKSRNYKLVTNPFNLKLSENSKESKIQILICGFFYLINCGVPIVGYQKFDQRWMKIQLPDSLSSNIVHLKLRKLGTRIDALKNKEVLTLLDNSHKFEGKLKESHAFKSHEHRVFHAGPTSR